MLLVVYGLLEAGRAVFMYAAVTNASREAVRYASGWGRIGNAEYQQYQDCTGIRAAAKNVGFLLGLSDSYITIGWDDGTSTLVNPYCPAGGSSPDPVVLASSDRVVVTVSATFRPVLPLFIPLAQNTMTSTSRRTIMGIVDLPPVSP
jgi:Flp pilus assembly protein TadG